jgi:hypothetical protein
MKRYMSYLALVVVLMGASPVLANLVYTPKTGGPNSIGLLDPANPGTLNTVYVTSGSGAMQSNVFVFDFGLHIDRFFDAEFLHFSFLYDNSSIEVWHAQPLGPWSTSTYGTQPADWWPNPSSGIVVVPSLHNGFLQSTSFQPMDPSAVYPFFRVTLHVKSAHLSQLNDFRVTHMTAKHHFISTSTIGPAMWTYWGGRIHEVPEPTTAMLAGAGVAVVGGRVVRRRRRSA